VIFHFTRRPLFRSFFFFLHSTQTLASLLPAGHWVVPAGHSVVAAGRRLPSKFAVAMAIHLLLLGSSFFSIHSSPPVKFHSLPAMDVRRWLRNGRSRGKRQEGESEGEEEQTGGKGLKKQNGKEWRISFVK